MIINQESVIKSKLYKQDVIDLINYPNSEVRNFYKVKNKATVKSLDLSGLSQEIKELIIDFVVNAFSSDSKSIKTTHVSYIVPLNVVLPIIRKFNGTSLVEFLETDIEENYNQHSFIKKLYRFALENEENEYIINLKKSPNEGISKYYQTKNQNVQSIIDIRSQQSLLLKSEVIGFVNYAFNQNGISQDNVHASYIRPLIGILLSDRYSQINSLTELSLKELEKNCSEIKKIKTFMKVLNRFLVKYFNVNNLLAEDEWEVRSFNLSEERINNSRIIKFLNFSSINSLSHKQLIKMYIEHLLVDTDKSISTINSELSGIKSMVRYFDDIPLKSITRDDVVDFYDALSEDYSNPRSFNTIIYKSIRFFEFLVLKGEVKCSYFYVHDTKKNIPYNYKETSVDKFVIHQMFNILDKMKPELSLIFLLIYCTGMRVSEACQVKVNCLQKSVDGCFVKYYSVKMKKNVTNIIPENLYNLLDEYIKSLPLKQEYLFLSKAGTSYQSGTFYDKVNEYCRQFKIKDVDGSDYVFRPHDYRHTMGHKMLSLNLPFQYIQRQLHHESPEMTLAYVEYSNRQKIKKMNEFVNINGDKTPITTNLKIEEEMNAEYLRAYINAQMLPNGVCAKPVKLGKCPHANSCLTCSDFRTSIDDLETHKAQLCRTNQYIAIAEEQGWIMQVESNRVTKQNLEKIITALETIKEEDSVESD